MRVVVMYIHLADSDNKIIYALQSKEDAKDKDDASVEVKHALNASDSYFSLLIQSKLSVPKNQAFYNNFLIHVFSALKTGTCIIGYLS